jgi:hypothetical protein
MMSVLTDVCAGSQLQKITDLVQAYAWLAQQHATPLAVSSSYYALFHLLVSEAVANWKTGRQRAGLARAFEHGKMKKAAERAVPFAVSGFRSERRSKFENGGQDLHTTAGLSPHGRLRQLQEVVAY